MHQTYNLIDEDWIPVLRKDLSVEKVGLRTLFHQSHEIVDISSDLPTMRFSLFRIALAILRRSVDELMYEEPEEYWTELWEEQCLPIDAVDSYLDSVHDRFDLLDPQKPFMQTPGLHIKSKEWKGLNLIIADSSGGDALYMHRNPKIPLDFGKAAQWLIHANAFDYSGIKSGAVGDSRVNGNRGKAMGIGWSGWLGGTIINGNTLKETLLLNYAIQPEVDLSKDLPIWEEPPLTSAARPGAQAYGQLSLITWPQRRILLHSNGSAIDGVLVCNGDKIEPNSQIMHETMTPWKLSKTESRKAKKPIYRPKSLDPEEHLWRGLQSFLPQVTPAWRVLESYGWKDTVPDVQPPDTVIQLVERIGAPLPEDFQLNLTVTSSVYGTQLASFSTIVEDRLTFPALLAAVDREDLRDIAETGVERSMAAIDTFAQFAANIARAETDSQGAPKNSYKRARDVAFSLLDGEFRLWLSRLSINSQDAEKQLQQWTDQVRALILKEGQNLARQASPVAWRGRKKDKKIYTLGLAEMWFRAEIYEQLPT